MQISLSLILPLLALSVSAIPLEVRQSSAVTVALSNDLSGATATATFQPDNIVRGIFSLYGTTSVGAGGTVKASSAFLNSAPQNINCVIFNGGVKIATLTNDKSYADLDGNLGQAVPVSLNSATIQCHV